MKYLKIFEEFKEKKKKLLKVHTLSGIAVVVEDRILLVQASKYRGMDNKWSIPKGHIEGNHSLESALKELEEETGIHLDKNYDEEFDIEYIKGNANKIMDVYVYHVSKEEISKYLNGWSVRPELYDSNEILSAKFFKISSALKKMEAGMLNILDLIFVKK